MIPAAWANLIKCRLVIVCCTLSFLSTSFWYLIVLFLWWRLLSLIWALDFVRQVTFALFKNEWPIFVITRHWVFAIMMFVCWLLIWFSMVRIAWSSWLPNLIRRLNQIRLMLFQFFLIFECFIIAILMFIELLLNWLLSFVVFLYLMVRFYFTNAVCFAQSSIVTFLIKRLSLLMIHIFDVFLILLI